MLKKLGTTGSLILGLVVGVVLTIGGIFALGKMDDGTGGGRR